MLDARYRSSLNQKKVSAYYRISPVRLADPLEAKRKRTLEPSRVPSLLSQRGTTWVDSEILKGLWEMFKAKPAVW